MKRVMSSAMVMWIAVLPAVASAATAPPRARAAAPEVSRAVSADGRAAVVTLTGDAARDHLAKLRAKHPQAFAKADAVMAAKGFHRTETVVVRSLANASAVRPAQSYSDGSGEVTFWSWDDGDNSTWEGEMYVEDYSTGDQMLVDGQIVTVNSDLPVPWEQTVYSTTEIAPPATEGASSSDVQLAAYHPRNGIELAQSRSRRHLQNWAWCVAATCWAGVVGCLTTGPAWPECAAATCLGAMVGCAIAELHS